MFSRLLLAAEQITIIDTIGGNSWIFTITFRDIN